MAEKPKLTIGPGTGEFYYNKNVLNYEIASQERFVVESGANAVEMTTALIPERLGPFLIDQKLRFEPMAFRTAHLAADMSNPLPTFHQALFARDFSRKQSLDYVVIHPDTAKNTYYQFADDLGAPLAIENMDKTRAGRENGGVNIRELEALLQEHPVKFVYDVQHAWEHDPNCSYANDLWKMVKPTGKLAYLHVSGQNGKNGHALVYRSENAHAIVSMAARILDEQRVPIILEGNYNSVEDLKKEIDFLRAELSG